MPCCSWLALKVVQVKAFQAALPWQSLLWTSHGMHGKPLQIISLATHNPCSEKPFASLCSLLVESSDILSSVLFFAWGMGVDLRNCSNNQQFCFASFLEQCCWAQKTHPGKLVAIVEGTADDRYGGILAKRIWIKHHADSHFALIPLLPEFYREKPLIVTGCMTWAVH